MPPSTSTRRTFLRSLALFGTASVVAGCQSTSSDDTTTTTPEGPPTLAVGETATIDDLQVTVADAHVQRSLFVLTSSAHTDVAADVDSQYLRTTVATDADDELDAVGGALELRIDDESYPLTEHAFPPGDEGMVFAFRIPADIDASSATLRWVPDEIVTARWELPDSAVQRMNAVPRFGVPAFSVPAEVQSNTDFDVTVDITNDGDRAGTFRAELGPSTLSDQPDIEVEVPADDRVTSTHTLQVSGESGESVTVILDWGRGREEESVTITE